MERPLFKREGMGILPNFVNQLQQFLKRSVSKLQKRQAEKCRWLYKSSLASLSALGTSIVSAANTA
jgi:hypothetical protein